MTLDEILAYQSIMILGSIITYFIVFLYIWKMYSQVLNEMELIYQKMGWTYERKRKGKFL